MKIAILILAHKNIDQVRKLVDVLKRDFEVFIHFDKRFPVPAGIAEEHVHVADRRYTTYWGSYYTQLAILELLKQAHSQSCDYYMLISGQDLPLMTNERIKTFVSDNYKDIFYHFELPRESLGLDGGQQRMTLYWDTKYESGNSLIRPLILPIKGAFYSIRKLQTSLGIYRPLQFRLFCGSLWLNLTNNAVTYILEFIEKNPWYIKRYKLTRCTDEIFFHSILLGFDYNGKNAVVNDDMRYIDWTSGPQYPRTLTMVDYRNCIQSGRLFGRKFDQLVDEEIIEKILQEVA